MIKRSVPRSALRICEIGWRELASRNRVGSVGKATAGKVVGYTAIIGAVFVCVAGGVSPGASLAGEIARGTLAEQEPPARGKERSVMGVASSFSAGTRPVHKLVLGDRLFSGPRTSAELLIEVPRSRGEGLDAVVLERRKTLEGEWLRVRWAGVLGWLQIGESPSLSAGAAVVLKDEDRLHRRELLGSEARRALSRTVIEDSWQWELPLRMGRPERRSIRVWSDLDSGRSRQLRRLAECLPGLYSERFGSLAAPPDLPIEVVVFAEQSNYRRFVESSTSLGARGLGGFEVDGLVVLAVASELAVDFFGTAAHELTHALNRLAFPNSSPAPWAEEGMAEDMAHSVEAAFLDGVGFCQRPGGWSRTRQRKDLVMEKGKVSKVTELTRSARSRSLLCYAVGENTGLVARLDRQEFSNLVDRRRLYVEALLLVRSLMAEDEEISLAERSITAEKARARIVSELRLLHWRAEERELMGC